jgi:ATP-binding cassette, subfamily B, multidrug efflux pump
MFLLVATFSQLLIPSLVKKVIDVVTQEASASAAASGRTSLENMLIWYGIAIVGLAILRGVFAFLQAYSAERSSQTVAFDLRNELFEKIQRLSFSYHDRTQTGQLMVRATDDVEKLRMFIGQGLLMALSALVLLSGTLIILLATNARLTLVILPILPFAFALFIIFGTISRPLFSKVQQRLSAMNTVLQENLAGIAVIKAFSREQDEQAKFLDAAKAVMKQQISIARAFMFLFPLIFLIGNLGQALVQYYGGRQVISHSLTLGEWQEFTMYLIFLFMPIGFLGMITAQMSQASASAARIFEILDAKSDVADRPGALPMALLQGKVAFEKVTFRYFGSGEAVLKDVSFEAEPGQTTALLGATGSGKTTIINLIPRFYDPSGGRITMDGNDLRDVTLESLRSQIGIVLQETTLFTGTIRDNIAFGKPDAGLDEVIAAAQAAAAHDFILSFPDGYLTIVGERGATLSGGQKQRIAIARALLLDPRILILDDSTSSVDLATERQIQEALDQLMKGRTSFIIAQRISTVLKADQILVLDKGMIVARGRHEELLEENEAYAEIYNSQLLREDEGIHHKPPTAKDSGGD